MNTQARIAELTEYLQRTQADQGGERQVKAEQRAIAAIKAATEGA